MRLQPHPKLLFLMLSVWLLPMAAHAQTDADGNGSLTRDEPMTARKSFVENVEPSVEATFADVAYGAHEKQKFDLWVADSSLPTPLVIYIHGGGFSAGDKSPV